MMMVLIGENYGLYVDGGTTSLYDGVLKGTTDGYTGTISAIAPAAIIKNGTETIDDVLYQTDYLVAEKNFLELDGVEYNSFTKALAAVPENGSEASVIKVIAGGVVDDEQILIKYSVVIPSNKKVILDMNNHTLSFTQPISNSGNLKVTDNSENKNGTITLNAAVNLIENSGTLTVENVKLVKENASGVAISNTGTLTVDSSGITSSGTSISTTGGSTEIINSNVKALSGTTISGSYSSVTIQSGNVTAESGTTIVTGVAFTATINGGTVESKTSNVMSTSRWCGGQYITINGGEVIGANNGIYQEAYAGADITITGGTIRGTNNGLNIVAGSINMTGGTVESTSGNGIATQVGTTITGGLVKGATNGLYATSTTTIGVNDNVIKQEADGGPVFIGGTYGLYLDNGTTYYYDGALKGKTDAYYGEIYSIPENSDIKVENKTIDGEEYIVDTLEVASDIVTDGTTNYNNLQTAIDSVSNGATLTLLKNVSLYSPVTIDKDITFDTHGYTIFAARKITSTGDVKFYSSTTQSKIYTVFSIEILTNTGTMDLSNIEFQNNKTSYYQFVNNGTATIDGIKITGVYGINCGSSATTTLSNNTVTVTATAIANAGKITINSGTYNGNSYGLYDTSSTENTIINSTISSEYHNGSSINTIHDNTIGGINNAGANNIAIFEDNIVNGSISNSGTMTATDITMTGSISNGGTMTASNVSTISSISNSGTLTLSDGSKMESAGGGIRTAVSNTNILNINDSTLKDTVNAIDSSYYDTYLISNSGTINANNAEILSVNYDPSYASVYVINSSNGTLNFNNTDVKLDALGTYYNIYGYGIVASGNTKINLNNSNVIVDKSDYAYGIYYNSTNTESSITNSNVTVSSSLNNGYSHCIQYGLYINNGAFSVLSGDINVSSVVSAHGAYVNAGTLTMGEEEDISTGNKGTRYADVSINDPEIKATGSTGIGVRKINGTFNFYDGVIIASTDPKPDTTSNVEEGFEVTYEIQENTNYRMCYLTFLGDDNIINTQKLGEDREILVKYIGTNEVDCDFSESTTCVKNIKVSNSTMDLQASSQRVNIFLGNIVNTYDAGDITYTITDSDNNIVKEETVLDNEFNKVYLNVMHIDPLSYKNLTITFKYNGSNATGKVFTGELRADLRNDVGGLYTYNYTGSSEEFVVPKTGSYKIEAWGAQGGSYSSEIYGGYGGYSTGVLELNKDDVLYINVGGQGGTIRGTNATLTGGYNGGGNAYINYEYAISTSSGGGATHVATQSNLLEDLEEAKEDILIVSGGGGGSSWYSDGNYGLGGSGGGRPDMASGAGKDPSKINEALGAIDE